MSTRRTDITRKKAHELSQSGVEPALIGIDWGTSSFRAWLMAEDGRILAKVKQGTGILAVPENNFEAAFETAVGGWFHARPDMPVLASGMITSRNGWIETTYLPLPTGVSELAEALTPYRTTKGRQIYFVAGTSINPIDSLPDVIRGEETEIIGHLGEKDAGLFIMPGTHSKWVQAHEGKLVAFATVMTGELYGLLMRDSSIRRLATIGDFNPKAFVRGVRVALEAHRSILATIFSARTLVLFSKLAGEDVADYLSGLLIGEEIRSELALHDKKTPIGVVGRGDLSQRYALALREAGVKAESLAPSMAYLGHLKIAKQAGLL